MRNERLIRLVGTDERPLLDTYHDRIRSSMLEHMDPELCQTTHLSLAEVIEKEVGGVSPELVSQIEADASQSEELEREAANPRVYDLAYHFDAAGKQQRAWIYGFLAAQQARRQYALDVATEQYAIARRNAEQTTDVVRYRIALGAGEALMLLGNYEEAMQQLEGIIDLAAGPEQQARIELLQGEIAFKQGSVDESAAFFLSGLRRLGNWVPKTRFGFGCAVLRELVIQFGHSLVPWRLHRKAPTDRFDLVIGLFSALLRPFVFQNTLKMLWAHVAGMNRAELVPPALGLVLSQAMHGMTMSMLGWHKRGTRYGDRALALAFEMEDLRGQGISRAYRGTGLVASARYEEGLSCLAEAIEDFDKAGDLWEVNITHFHAGCCHYGLGNLSDAIIEARWAFESSARIGDSRILCSSYLWARATRGDIPFEEMKSCYPDRPDDIMSTVHGIMAQGHWHTFHGRTTESLEAFERASELVWKNFCVNFHMILVMPVLAAAFRRRADAVQSVEPHQADQLRKRAFRTAKWAARITRLFPAAHAESLRELSLQLEARGKTRKALKIADRSCAVAQRQKEEYEYAQSLLVRGRLARELGLPEAEQQIQTAEAALETFDEMIQDASSIPIAANTIKDDPAMPR